MAAVLPGRVDSRLASGALHGTIATLATLAVGVLLTPFILRGAGAEPYGAWIFALAVADLAGFATFGLGRGISREIARESMDEGARGKLLAAALRLYLAAGVAGFAAVAFATWLLGPMGREVRLYVGATVGLAFVFNQLSAFATEVLTGSARFATLAWIATGAALARAAATLALLAMGLGLAAVALGYLGASILAAIALLGACRAVVPRLGIPLAQAWRSLAPQREFWTSSQLNALLARCIWQSSPILLGLIADGRAVALYFVAWQLPMVALAMLWRAGDVVYVAAGKASREGDAQPLLQGTRLLVLLAAPVCGVGAVVVPDLLLGWVGEAPPALAGTSRIALAVVFVEALGISAYQVVWASGRLSGLLRIVGAGAVTSLASAVALIPVWGIVGAAIAMLLAIGLVTALVVRHAAARSGVSPAALVEGAVGSAFVATLAAVAAAAAVSATPLPPGWISAFASGAAGMVAFLGTLLFRTGGGERELVMRALGRAKDTVREIHFVRTHWILAHEIVAACRYRPVRVAAGLEREFAGRVDPMGFHRPVERVRFDRALEFLDAARGEARFRSALEIGCAEGLFTELMSARCDEVLAVDVSPSALERARERCAGNPNVSFARWDLHESPLPRRFDLIVVVGVVEYMRGPRALRAVRRKLVQMLEPGGYLLIGTTVRNDRIESSWWTRFIPRWSAIHRFMARDPKLEALREARDQAALPFEHMLLRRRA